MLGIWLFSRRLRIFGFLGPGFANGSVGKGESRVPEVAKLALLEEFPGCQDGTWMWTVVGHESS
jgi:hypothetical protein